MKMKSLVAVTALLASMAMAPGAYAAVIFSDNFDSTPDQLNQFSFSNWTVTAGSVDVIGNSPTPNFYNFYPGQGNYVDLNGSTDQNGQLSSKTVFGAGTYTLSFLLGGSTGGAGGVDSSSKTTLITLGSFSASITLAPNAGLTSDSFTFSTTGGNLVFTSLAGGNPNVGNILDNVQVSAVPELATWAMMLLGFAGIGFVAYRRTRNGLRSEMSAGTS
jgi:hypothetical protein